jgi:RNA-directed DNA polymerase
MGAEFRARIVNYADDFVILSRGKAVEALAWTRWAMGRIGLTLNETKTRLCDGRTEHFNFLGYTFGPERFRKDGHWYLAAKPSRKAVQRLKGRVREVLGSGIVAPWPEVRDHLNRVLRGWSAYFSYGTRLMAYRAIDNHVQMNVRNFLQRRHKVPGRGTRRFSDAVVFGELGVLRLRWVQLGRPAGADS